MKKITAQKKVSKRKNNIKRKKKILSNKNHEKNSLFDRIENLVKTHPKLVARKYD